MIFSLNSVAEDLELQLAHASFLPIFIETSQLKFGDKFSYKFFDQISQLCGKFQVIAKK